MRVKRNQLIVRHFSTKNNVFYAHTVSIQSRMKHGSSQFLSLTCAIVYTALATVVIRHLLTVQCSWTTVE